MFKPEGAPSPPSVEEVIIKNFFKKPKTNITSNLRRQVWDLYIGVGTKTALCPLCGINRISNYESNGGFEACHIVASKFFHFDLSVYYLFPGCSTCNNDCSSMCLLDFLWCRGRITPLKNLISCVFNTFINEHTNDLKPEDLLAHKIIEHLYGENRFPSGGGVKNTHQIYEVARLVHYQELIEEGAQLAKKQKQNMESLTLLMECKIQTMKLFI